MGLRKGIKFTEEHKQKISKALMGHSVTDAIKKRFTEYSKHKVPWNKGKKNLQQSGKNHWHWKGGITSDVKKRVNDYYWKQLRKLVYERDYWTCQICFKHCKNHEIQCHHIVPWNISHNDNMNNLVTLCVSCHMRIEKNLDK